MSKPYTSYSSQIISLEDRLIYLEDQYHEMETQKNNAYKERNKLVALLATIFPSGKKKTAIEGWDPAWHNCVYIEFPWGQASWHYHDLDEWMFENIGPYNGEWDGHTTEQKYNKIMDAVKNPMEWLSRPI